MMAEPLLSPTSKVSSPWLHNQGLHAQHLHHQSFQSSDQEKMMLHEKQKEKQRQIHQTKQILQCEESQSGWSLPSSVGVAMCLIGYHVTWLVPYRMHQYSGKYHCYSSDFLWKSYIHNASYRSHMYTYVAKVNNGCRIMI